MILFLKNRLKPFKYPTYRKYFAIQLISQVGTWSHELARAWLVLELMGKASALGVLALTTSLPVLFLILQGGVIADKKEVQRLLVLTRTVLAFSALIFAAVVEWSDIQFWHILLFGLIEGTASSFDQPAIQAMASRLVPKEDFQQALAINSTNFHLGRTLGPLVAGLLMAFHGPSLVFLFDGISYLIMAAIILKLDLLPDPRSEESKQRPGWSALMDGFSYLFKNMRYKLLQLLMTICLVLPLFVVIMRTYLKHKFELSSEEFGLIFSAPALGSTAAAIFFIMAKFRNPLIVLKYSIPAICCTYIALTLIDSIGATTAILGIGGFFSYLNFASLTHSMHLTVHDDYRGRMGALIGLGFLSLGPLMGYPVGYFADWIGYENSTYFIIASFAALSAIFAVKWVVLKPDSLHPAKNGIVTSTK